VFHIRKERTIDRRRARRGLAIVSSIGRKEA
jgi:hypothetical protein